MLRKFFTLVLTAAVIAGGTLPLAAQKRDRDLTVVTYNMYLGAELGDLFFVTTPEEMFSEVTEAYFDMLSGSPAERAAEVADQIQFAAPHVVGLQEVSLWRTGPFQDQAPATNVTVDQLQLLLDELAERGLNYEPIVVQQNLDAELSGFVPNVGPQDIRYTDRIVILARSDLKTSQLKIEGTESANFTYNLQLPVLGNVITVYRGWAAADIQMRGKNYRFVTAHLESYALPVQLAQAAELINLLDQTDRVVVLTGDFNSNAEDPENDDTYLMLLGAGYTDVWDHTYPTEPGYTWALSGEIPNTTEIPDERLDYVMVRGNVTPAAIDRLGEEAGDRSPGGFWASDHAGLSAGLVLNP
jgi:endonuclease/exonuclease/phosphatase family metal-dependent hydrolase